MITKFATNDEPPYEMNGSVTPVSGDHPDDAADDHEGLHADDGGEAGGEQLRERAVGLEGDAEAAADEQQEQHARRDRPEQAASPMADSTKSVDALASAGSQRPGPPRTLRSPMRTTTTAGSRSSATPTTGRSARLAPLLHMAEDPIAAGRSLFLKHCVKLGVIDHHDGCSPASASRKTSSAAPDCALGQTGRRPHAGLRGMGAVAHLAPLLLGPASPPGSKGNCGRLPDRADGGLCHGSCPGSPGTGDPEFRLDREPAAPQRAAVAGSFCPSRFLAVDQSPQPGSGIHGLDGLAPSRPGASPGAAG